MAWFAVKRLLVAIPVVLLATLIVFLLVSARGDPLRELRNRPGVPERTIQNLEEKYHLDESRPEQYVSWLGDFVTGDWGTSFRSDRPVTEVMRTATGNTLLLVVPAVTFSVLLALWIGSRAGSRRHGPFDVTSTSFSYFGFSMPDFFFALMLQLLLVIVLKEQFDVQLFYVQGKYSIGDEGDIVNLVQHMVLPIATLMLTMVAAWSRFQRDSMVDVLRADHIRTARAKGVPQSRIVRKHALRNASIPFVTVVALDTGILLGGVVVVERVFQWPGLGYVFFQALERADYPVLLAWMAIATAFVVLANLAADILYAVLDPRIRVGGAAVETSS